MLSALPSLSSTILATRSGRRAAHSWPRRATAFPEQKVSRQRYVDSRLDAAAGAEAILAERAGVRVIIEAAGQLEVLVNPLGQCELLLPRRVDAADLLARKIDRAAEAHASRPDGMVAPIE